MNTYSEYKDSGIDWIGKIPKGWELGAFKYYFDLYSGFGFPQELQGIEKGKFPFFKVSDINGFGTYISQASNYVEDEVVQQRRWKILPKKTILCAKIGEALRKNHRKISEVESLIDNNMLGIKPKQDLIYAFYLLKIIDMDWFVNPGAVPSISVQKLKYEKIPLPPLPEQKAIASFLDNKTSKINDLVKNKQKLIDLLKEQRLAIINHAVTKGLNKDVELVDSNVNWIGQVPKHWTVNKLKYVSKLLFSNVDKKTNDGETLVKSCNYVDVYKNEFIDENISFLDISATDNEIDKFSIKKGDVLVTKDSETPQDIAVPALATFELNNILCGYHLAMIREKEDLLGEFVFRIFQSKDFNTHFEISAKGVTRYGLSMEAFKNAFVPIPPLSEQKEIVKFLNNETSQIDKSIEKIQKEIELLQEYKEALISEAVTGKIKIKEDTK